MEDLNIDNLSPEQKKDLQDTISKVRMSLLFASMKFGLILFGANFVSMSLGIVILVDANPAVVVGYHVFTVITNAIFATLYFNRQMKKNSDIVSNKIKEILKK